MKLACTVGLGLLFAASSALASPAIATSAPPKEKGDRRTEVNLGMLVGGSDIAQTQRSTVGLQVSAGRRFGDLILLGEYDYLSVGKSTSSYQGTMSRVGVLARYSLLRTRGKKPGYGRRSPVSGDYWLEAGAGMSRITWDEGGTLSRPDVALGFGWQFNGVIGRKSNKPRYYGPYVAFRAFLSRAPDSAVDNNPAVCSGPCDTATKPPKNDVSMFAHFGINWGR